jgi:DNA repair protein RadA/Sms
MATYRCKHCGVNTERYTRLCTSCLHDNALYEIVGSSQTIFTPGTGNAVRAGDITTADEPKRLRTPFRNLNEALNGGFTSPGVIQVAGPPGSGKSTLTLQCLDAYAEGSLFVAGEETAAEVVRRARRLRLRHADALSIFCNNNPEEIQEEILSRNPSIVVVDSASVLQWSPNDYAGPALEAEIVRDLSRFAKKQHAYADRPGREFTLFLISHVLKTGEIAGLKSVEHDVDMTLVMDMNPPVEGGLEINTKKLTKDDLARREIYVKLRTIQVKKTRAGRAPVVLPRFLLEDDGLHEYNQ